MARSSVNDPIEKFRFSVEVIALTPNATGVYDTAVNYTDTSQLKILSRSGFSEVTTPQVKINEMLYRENIDNTRFSKIPGLALYEPVTMRRGVTNNRNLYNWYRQVNNDLALITSAQELVKDQNFPPDQKETFRREVIIRVYNRGGEEVKQWILFNAFPIEYRAGNDLNANINEKLVEELTLTYEFFVELEGGAEGLLKELARDAAERGISTAFDMVTKRLPFSR